jgi:hypothetical protein
MDSLPHSTPKRTKHAALARPDVGEFGRHELAILGAPCGDIQALVARLLPHLAPELRVAYVDADHAAGDAAASAHDSLATEPRPAPHVAENGLSAELVDKITHRQLNQLAVGFGC